MNDAMTKPLVQSATVDYFNLELRDVDESGQDKVVTYKLCYDYNAIARVEEALKLDLKNFQEWRELSSAKFPTLIWCGLARYHKTVTLDDVRNLLNPANERELLGPIIDLIFPGLRVALDAAAKEREEAIKAGKDPNASEPAAE